MKLGKTVRVVPPPEIVGTVVRRKVDTDDELRLLVQWKEGDNVVERWFDADALEEVKPTEEPAAPAEGSQS